MISRNVRAEIIYYTKHQVPKKSISDILFNDWINFPNLLRIELKDYRYLENGLYVRIATLHNCLTTFASSHEVDLCLTMIHCALQTKTHNR